MEQKTLIERIMKALSNTETLPAPEYFEPTADTDVVLGTASPAIQALHALQKELYDELKPTHDTAHKELEVCIAETLRHQLETIRQLMWALLRDEFKNNKNIHSSIYTVGMRTNWEVVTFEESELSRTMAVMGITISSGKEPAAGNA